MQLCLYQPEVIYGDPAANLQQFEACLARQSGELGNGLSGQGVNNDGSSSSGLSHSLVLLPELFTTGYVFEDREALLPLTEEIPDGATCQRLARLAQQYGITLVAGMAERQGDRLFNSAVAFGPQGFIGSYRKLAQTNIDRLYFERGQGLLTFDWTVGEQSLRCGVAICFDLWFPQVAQSYAAEEVDLLLHPANFGGPQTLMVARGQAIETGLAIATCNRTGQETARGLTANYRGESQLVDAQGQLWAQADDTATFLVMDVSPLSQQVGKARRILGVDWWTENQAIVQRLNRVTSPERP